MTEKLTIERTADGGLDVTLETAIGSHGALVMRRKLGPGPALGQLQILELQADLMAEALRLLERKVAAARQIDGQQSRPT